MIRHLADDEKPREKALLHGISTLTDAELLAILLRVGVAGKSVIDVSRDILTHFNGDLSRLARTSTNELTTIVKGIGPAKALTVIAALELGQRCRASGSRLKQQMSSSKCIFDYISEKENIESLDHEKFWVLMLNKRLCVESLEEISSGGMDATVVDIRMVVKRALDARAVAVALIHNHPSGSLKPSAQDDNLTDRIKAACKTLDIRVVDHLIITPTAYYSYSDSCRL